MGTISRLIRNVEAITIKEVVEDSIDQTKQALVRLQRLQMLMGEKSTGKKIGKYRSIPYALKKYAQNPLAGFKIVDLRLHGDFHAGIFADVRETSVVFGSTDSKAAKLVEDYGKDIFGLNKNHKTEYVKQYLTPEGVKQFRKRILK